MKIKVAKTIGGVAFVAELEHVKGKGVPTSETRIFQRAIVRKIIEDGPASAEAFSFLRKMMDLRAATLAEWLDTDAETVSRWENGRQAFPHSAWLTLRQLAEEHLRGKKALRQRLESDVDKRGLPLPTEPVVLDLAR